MTVGSRLKAAASGVASRLIDYQINRLVALSAPPPAPLPELPAGYRLAPADASVRATLVAHPDRMVAKSAAFLAPHASGFAVLEGGEVAAVAIFHDSASFASHPVWRLRPGEAGLVELVTAPAHRSRGLATTLIVHASAAMFAAGANRLVSWMWWSNTASLHAFRRAGYDDAGWQVGVRPPWRKSVAALRLVRGAVPRAR